MSRFNESEDDCAPLGKLKVCVRSTYLIIIKSHVRGERTKRLAFTTRELAQLWLVAQNFQFHAQRFGGEHWKHLETKATADIYVIGLHMEPNE